MNIMQIWPLGRGGGGGGEKGKGYKVWKNIKKNNWNTISLLYSSLKHIAWGICSCMLVSLYNLYCKIFSQLWFPVFLIESTYNAKRSTFLAVSFVTVEYVLHKKTMCFFHQTVKNVCWINLILHMCYAISHLSISLSLPDLYIFVI